jgi:hypothetical protein
LQATKIEKLPDANLISYDSNEDGSDKVSSNMQRFVMKPFSLLKEQIKAEKHFNKNNNNIRSNKENQAIERLNKNNSCF